jgi:hypothetical protein
MGEVCKTVGDEKWVRCAGQCGRREMGEVCRTVWETRNG